MKTVTISALLESRATAQREDTAYVFLSHSETGVGEERLTYADLDTRARAVAASLTAAGAAGERVALLLPPGPEFVVSFLGCLYAGAVAVPALPPRRRGGDARLAAICRDARPRVALTSAAHLPALENAAAEIPELAAARRMTPATSGGADWRRPELGPEALAFLQYTSGSTSSPKGVRVTHGNLLYNEERIRHAFGQSAESIVLGWLPLHHDMGLIGTVLQPLYTGAVCYLMTPGAFLQRPARWLEALSRYRATTSGGPNFAYELCVQKVAPAEREGLDLSSWQVAFNGAEPVQAGTLRRFAEAFAPCGFRAAAFRPCYGLAEATLLVSGWREGGGPRVSAFDAQALERHAAVEMAGGVRSRELVGCGVPQEKVLVVDAESGEACPPGRIGEIWVAGPSVAQGYWERPEETEATFGARLADGSGPFLRTGDLGFLAGGELFLTGRLKDLVILRGRNHYPQDIESTVERSHSGLRSGASAAFAVEAAGEERLVVVCEMERRLQLQTAELPNVADAIRRAVAEEHGVPVAGVALLRTGTIPKTTSGKIRRRECRERYLAGELEELYRSDRRPAAAERLLTRVELLALAPEERAAALTAWLCEEIACRAGAGAGDLAPETAIAATGLDSLGLFELEGRLAADLGCALPATTLVELSIAGLCALLLEQLAQGAEPGSLERPELVPGEVLGDHPASPGQEALWLLEPPAAGEGDEGLLHIVGAARLGTAVDGRALLAAARALSERHAALRTSFRVEDGELLQTVHANLPPDLEQVDATTWNPEEMDAALRRAARRRFDLGKGPPLRIRLFVRPEGERVLLLVLHHLAGDFGSLAVLVRDWAALYARELDASRPALPDLPVAYTDFARWQRQWLAGPAGKRLERYWLDRLRGAPLVLDLPADRPRRPGAGAASRAGARRSLRLTPGLTGRMRTLARTQGATLFTTLLAAFQVLLGRLSGQDDLLVGSPTTGRRDPALAGVVGYFVNPVVLRAELAGDPPFAAFLARTRASVAAALERRDLPFAHLTGRLQPERDAGRPPVVQVFFVLQRAAPGQEPALAGFAVGEPGSRIDSEGLALESLRLDPGAVQLDLALAAAEVGDALVLACEHATALFDGVTVERWLAHLESLLDAAAARPNARLGELPLLRPAERHQLRVEWNDAPAAVALGVVELFEQQARRTPEAVAVALAGDEVSSLTYGELDRRAEHLAARLRALGVGPEVPVGLCVEASPDLAVGVLGIWKSGGAYLPLDPTHPPAWLAFLLEDSAAPVLVARPHLAAAFPPHGARLVPLSADEEAGKADRERTQPGSLALNHLAYLIYTSGTTGRPKAVQVEHGRLAATLGATRERFRFAADDRVACLALPTFDISLFELLSPLPTGGTAVLFPRRPTLDVEGLVDRLGELTCLHAVPALMREIVESLRRRGAAAPAVTGMRAVFVGGDAVPADLLDDLRVSFPGARMWVLYGPTEGTIVCAAHPVPECPLPARGLLGRPLAGAVLHVCDGDGELLPPGVAGELWIGGSGVARGYLERAELTAEKFVPGDRGRFYRSGDRVRRLADGTLEFLGRGDDQVKIRGIRIEPGEIEAALVSLPAVRAAAVTVREDRPGERRLVAYVAGDATPEALRRRLGERLPDAMVPAAFVILATLPLTPNGKVDRRALPAPEETSAPENVAPRTVVEEVLAGIWAEVLGLERVGADGHFFELGGHSLLAMRVASRLRGAFGVEMPLSELFEAPRLPDLAARIEAALRATGAGSGRPVPPLAPIPPALRGGLLPLSFAQQRLWFLDQIAPGSPLYNMPGALRIEGPLDGSLLALCLAEIVRRHEALRTVFPARDGAPVQRIEPPYAFVLPVVDLSGLPEEIREALALSMVAGEAVRPFDLARGPLLRGVLLRLAEESHLAALTLHHIASDGWSLGILVREITALYAAFAAGRPSPLPELPVQYADFAVWQRSWLEGEILAEELAFWRLQLAGLPPLLALPTDRPRPAVQNFRGGSRPVSLPPGLTRDLEALARRSGATLFMVLLAGFQALLARISGQEDLAVGSPVSGRTHREVEPLIGFFVNTLVLRGDLSGAPSFRELLGRVRETSLAAYLHQDVPFEKLVDELAPERSLAYSPLLQVMLALQNAPAESLEIEALRLQPVRVGTGTAKFDLTISLEEQDGGLEGTIEYAADLFDGATMDRLLLYYERLLRGCVAADQRPLGELPLLSEAELHQVRSEWNAAGAAPGISVVERFERWAEEAPDATAVLAPGEALSYAGLAARADRLARRLHSLGVTLESRVGLCAERSPAMIVAVLSILKAGAAYVPLDPEYPRERLAFMVADARVPVLVAEERWLGRLPETAAATVLLDVDGRDDESAERLPALATPESLAYMIYTSGSTGRPKGVMVHHRGWSNLAEAQRLLFGIKPGDRMLQFASLSFDASAWEISMAFGAGATLLLGPRERRLSREELTALLAESTAALLPPSVLPTLSPGDVPGLATLIVGGEACPMEVARTWASGRRLWNAYGPTEATVCATLELYDGGERLPIGRPIAGMEAWVLDAWGSPAPIGVVGELCLGGPGLARGYSGQPAQTASRFVPHPQASSPGERLYRTGDLAFRRPDGSLEYLGRLDSQVKIRGFRIEPGEIEAALATLPGVREAAVLVREDRPGDRRLVAYVSGDAAADALRRALYERLPDYMVPASFVTLAALPLTPNGKVDRKALPAPEPPIARESSAAPRTREEELLAAVWAQVLGLSRVGVNDNFFELGGDSILAVQIVAQASQVGLRLTVRQIFEHQTLAGLALQVTAAEPAGSSGSEQGPVVGEVPLTPIQRWFFAQDFAAPHHFNQALLLEPREPLSPAALERAMAAIVEHHDALRLRFDRQAGQGAADGWRQVNAPAEPATPFYQIDLGSLPAPFSAAAFENAAAALQAGFDLAAGPLTRLCLFHRGAGQSARLLWVTHHLVVDGVSWRVLLEDLEGAYRQAARGLHPSLPPKTTSFQEWARRLSGYAGSEELAHELDSWLEVVRAPAPRLPLDFPAGGSGEEASNLIGDETAVDFELSAEETADLLQALPAVYHNRIDEALLSALVRALAGWTRSPRLRLDVEGHGREPLFDKLDVSRTVGWFTTIHPLVLEAGDADPGEALVRTKERLRAVPGRGIGYGLLRHLGSAALLLETAPAAEILFNYLGQVDTTLGEHSLFRAAIAPTGPARSPRDRRTHLLEVTGIVAGGRLRITLTYGSRTHRRETVERLSIAYAGALRQLIQQGRKDEEVFTPSDFPQAALDAESFDKLAALLDEAD